jgi:hypothetical protein
MDFNVILASLTRKIAKIPDKMQMQATRKSRQQGLDVRFQLKNNSCLN